MRREIKLSLAYRDMWQSSCNRFPTAGQLVRVAPAIVGMGCFDRVETNGGAFEQVSLISGENPSFPYPATHNRGREAERQEIRPSDTYR